QKIEKDPLMRAFRLDKMTLAALETTLRIYMNEEKALGEIPVLRMLGTPLDELKSRAQQLSQSLHGMAGGFRAIAREDGAVVGGRSVPDEKMPTWVVEVQAQNVSDAEFGQRLRSGDPAVVARLQGGKVIFDLRTIFPSQTADLVESIRVALGD